MKILIRLLIVTVLILSCGIISAQNEFITLKSSDFIKGLSNKDFLRSRLRENGYKMSGKTGTESAAGGYYESWTYKNQLFVDIIYTPGEENTIKVGILDTFKGFPDRLIYSFPRKGGDNEIDHLSVVNKKLANKDVSYSLAYSSDTDKVRVYVWYDSPYYFFQFKDEK